MKISPIAFAPVFPLWLIILFFCIGLALVLVQYRVIREKVGRTKSLIISFLRLGAVSLLVAFALNPSMVTRKNHRISPAIAVFVDTSQSMGEVSSHNKTRLEEARAFLKQGPSALLQSLGEKYEVSIYGLADSLRLLSAETLDGLKAQGNKGDVNDVLKTVGLENSVAVLLSDGNLRWDGKPGKQLPIITVPVGNPAAYRDILIKDLKAPTIAFKGREITMDVALKSYGYKGLNIPVVLEESEKRLAVKNIKIQADPGEMTVSFSFVPGEVGSKNLTISVPPQAGEEMVANNRRNISIKVVRDKIRILMLSGSPSMNYRYMRIALKNDPSIDLLSFVILRSPSDVLNVPTREQSLIPFPVETLFTKELVNFDLLIFDNFNYSLYLQPDYLERLRSFIKEGGGFAIIGGPDIYNEGKYGLSPIADILPSRFYENEIYRRVSPVGMRLSREGAKHPMMRVFDELQDGVNDPSSFWQAMPPLDAINLMNAKSASSVLIESTDGIPWPILTTSEFGKGRLLVLATDYSWKWYTGLVARGQGNQPYLRFIHRMVRWLIKDPSLEPIHMTLPETVATTGHEVEIRIRSQGENLSPRSDAAVSFSVFNPAGVKIESKLKSTGHQGEYLLSFLPDRGGFYRIKVETTAGHSEESIIVSEPLESLDAAPDHSQLKKIAESTGGKHMTTGLDLIKEIEGYTQRAERQFVEEKILPLWATPVVMTIVLGLLSGEWYLRRRWGLI